MIELGRSEVVPGMIVCRRCEAVAKVIPQAERTQHIAPAEVVDHLLFHEHVGLATRAETRAALAKLLRAPRAAAKEERDAG